MTPTLRKLYHRRGRHLECIAEIDKKIAELTDISDIYLANGGYYDNSLFTSKDGNLFYTQTGRDFRGRLISFGVSFLKDELLNKGATLTKIGNV